jgi:Domain of unknown function (DUF4190)
MSHPPGSPDPGATGDEGHGGPVDPWATPPPGPGSGADPVPPPPPDEPPPYQVPYGQVPYGQVPYGQPPYGVPTNAKAQAALWTGVAAIPLSCCALGVLGVVPIVLGFRARSEIRGSAGQQGGEAMAMTGIVTGVVAVVLSLLVIGLVALLVATGDLSGFEGPTTTGA